ncbi:MAG: hypothetical protein AAGA36_00390 [Pseudomonadota bacterium]
MNSKDVIDGLAQGSISPELLREVTRDLHADPETSQRFEASSKAAQEIVAYQYKELRHALDKVADDDDSHGGGLMHGTISTLIICIGNLIEQGLPEGQLGDAVLKESMVNIADQLGSVFAQINARRASTP